MARVMLHLRIFFFLFFLPSVLPNKLHQGHNTCYCLSVPVSAFCWPTLSSTLLVALPLFSFVLYIWTSAHVSPTAFIETFPYISFILLAKPLSEGRGPFVNGWYGGRPSFLSSERFWRPFYFMVTHFTHFSSGDSYCRC